DPILRSSGRAARQLSRHQATDSRHGVSLRREDFQQGARNASRRWHASDDLQRGAYRGGLLQVQEQNWAGRCARGAASGATTEARAEPGAASLRATASCRNSHVTVSAGDRMTGKEIKNITTSVLAKLRDNSKSSGAPLQQVLQLYAMERFLYRISKSRHAQSVILKGPLLLQTIGIPSARPTVDIDMLRKGKADHASLEALIKDCATLEVEDDGLAFIADSVVAEDIAKDSEYKGTRVLMHARMDNVRLKIQIDFGVGDVMV